MLHSARVVSVCDPGVDTIPREVKQAGWNGHRWLVEPNDNATFLVEG